MAGVLQTRQGSVAELVEAERGVAAVNEEIDQARSWLAETRGAVASSQVTLNFAAAPAPAAAFLDPVTKAVRSVGHVLGMMTALTIVLAAACLPPAALWALVRGARRRHDRHAALAAAEG